MAIQQTQTPGEYDEYEGFVDHAGAALDALDVVELAVPDVTWIARATIAVNALVEHGAVGIARPRVV